MTKIKETVMESGKWYPWSRANRHICCNCNYRHDVDIKVDRRGVVWMRWTELEDGEI